MKILKYHIKLTHKCYELYVQVKLIYGNIIGPAITDKFRILESESPIHHSIF